MQQATGARNEWAGQREKQLSSLSSSGVRLVAVSGRGCMRDRFELFLWAWRVGWDRSIMGREAFLFLFVFLLGECKLERKCQAPAVSPFRSFLYFLT